MDQSAVDAATYWLAWLGTARLLAGISLSVGVALELWAEMTEPRFDKVVDGARRLALGEATAHAAEANERAAELMKQAEGERLARIKIEERIAWRTLSEEQVHTIAAKLAPLLGITIDVIAASGGGEVALLSARLSSAFFMAGWDSSILNLTGGITVVGISVQVDPYTDDRLSAAAAALVDALNGVGVETNPVVHRQSIPGGSFVPGPPKAPIKLWVGDRQ